MQGSCFTHLIDLVVNPIKQWIMMQSLLRREGWPLLQAGVLLIALCLPNGRVFAEPTPAGENRRIREIRINISDVYTEEEARKSDWAAFANNYHVKTRESVIRNEILFKAGDVLDEELIEQSERKLRRFAFLSEVRISVVPVDAGSVDVEVHTRDAWSLVPSLNFSGGGGLGSVNALVVESNLLGYGKKLLANALYESDVGWTTSFTYQDYQLFKSRWRGYAIYATGPLTESYFVSLTRPLYSLDTKWAYGGAVSSADQTIRRFEAGEESSRFTKDHVSVMGYAKRSFGERHNKTNVKLQLKRYEADYASLGSQTTEPLPPDQANLTPSIGLSKQHNIRWQEFAYLNKMGSTEDSWLGLRYSANVGYGIPVQDGFELWDLQGSAIHNIAFAQKQLLKSSFMVFSEAVRNTTLSANARYYKQFSRHTVASRLKVKLGYELDSTHQFTLGANNGLRGYPARQFTGERLMLINLEDRQFWGEYSLGPKIALGTVVFVDSGNVWKEDEAIELNDLNWSAGGGLRIGLSKLPKQPIIRIDVGWAIGDDEFAVTIGQEQHF